jgi:hypothetical protein
MGWRCGLAGGQGSTPGPETSAVLRMAVPLSCNAQPLPSAEAMSVLLKSSPLKSSGSLVCLARA